MAEALSLRSLLFVPGDRPDMIVKAAGSGADGVVVDLEDAVAPANKDRARRNVVDALAACQAPAGTRVFVRVNPPGSPWHAEDLAAVMATRADGVVLPKADDSGQLADLRDHTIRAGRPHVSVVVGLETARGVADATAILAQAAKLEMEAAYFGAEDYIADLGGRRTPEGTEVLYARSRVALAGRLAGIAVLDQVVVAVGDDLAFVADAENGRSMGYQGKLCIHPRQVPLAHQAFTPSASELAHARAVVEAVETAGGSGVIVLDGQMVDAVHLRMARTVIARAGHEQP